MKTLNIISTGGEHKKSGLTYREAVRAVLLDKNNMIPLLYVSKHDYYKLPGGGIDLDESPSEALHREIKEETGTTAEILQDVGKVVELWLVEEMVQISYCYFGKIISKGSTNFTENEISEGLKLVWFNLDECILKLKENTSTNYEGELIRRRDLAFLEEFNRINKNLQFLDF